jgi:rhodanese-related sulfurtransferase
MIKALAVAALVLGVLAAVAGSPLASQNARLDVVALAHAVEHEDDHVSALELAEWIRNRRPLLRIIDVRSSSDFKDYHVPGAERIELSKLVSTRFQPDETIVLYSDGGAHAAQGWVFLRALGYRHVYFLRGGLYEWIDQVMNPTLAANATQADREEFARTSAISKYFGGVPRIGDTSLRESLPRPTREDSPPATGTAVSRVVRRGC